MSGSAVRFFLGVSPHPSWIWAAFGAIVALQAWTLWHAPADAGAMLAAALLVQMFAASTGFCGPASRGHFDPLLTSGRSRPAVALAHLAASALPGLAAWSALALVEVALMPSRWPLALGARAVLAIALVSTIAWALTLRLPRLSGGALWLGLLFVGVLTREGVLAFVDRVTARDGVAGAVGLLAEAGARVAVPFLLLDPRPLAGEWAVLSIDLGVGLSVLAAALAFLSWRGYALAEE